MGRKDLKYELSEQQVQDVAQYMCEHFGKASFSLLAAPDRAITPLTSRIGGLPYWNFEHEYPSDNLKNPLRFICQINLQELQAAKDAALVEPLAEQVSESLAKANTADASNLVQAKKDQLAALIENMPQLPDHGLLQFFALADESFGCTYDLHALSNGTYRVVYIADTNQDKDLTMEQLKERLEEHDIDLIKVGSVDLPDDDYWPIMGECALKFKLGIDCPHIGDVLEFNKALKTSCRQALGMTFTSDPDGAEYIDYDLMEALEDSKKFEQIIQAYLNLTHEERNLHLGALLGYPDYTQCSPFEDLDEDDELASFDTMLLRLDDVEADGFSMMWGDCGIVDFFINSKQLAQKDFSKVFYTWDCC